MELKKNRYRFVIQTLVILVRICIGLIWASAGPLLPLIMQEYGISRGTVSWYVSAVPVIMASLTIPASIVGTRLGLKKMFAIGAFLQASGLLAPFCTSYVQLFLTRVLFGAGIAITIPTASAIAAEWFSPRELPLVNGITISLVSLGNTAAYAATIPIATAFSWQASITIYAAFAFICAIAWLILGKERQGLATQRDSPPKEKMPEMSLRAALKQKASFVLALSLLGPFCLSTAVSSWLPSYYHDAFGMPLARASSIVSIFTITGTIASFVGGILTMRIGQRKPFLLIPGLLFGLSALGCILFNNIASILISVALFGFFSSIQASSIFTIPMEIPGITPRTGAVVLSMALGVGNLGGFAGPIIVGYLADLTGSYMPGFLVCSALSLTLFFGGLLLPETGPKARKVIFAATK